MSSSPPLKPLHLFSSLFFSLFVYLLNHIPFTLSAPMKINSYHIKRFYSLSLLLSPLSDVVSITSDNVIENCSVLQHESRRKTFATSVSHVTSLYFIVFFFREGGQLVKFFTFFFFLPPQEHPAGVHKYAQ